MQKKCGWSEKQSLRMLACEKKLERYTLDWEWPTLDLVDCERPCENVAHMNTPFIFSFQQQCSSWTLFGKWLRLTSWLRLAFLVPDSCEATGAWWSGCLHSVGLWQCETQSQKGGAGQMAIQIQQTHRQMLWRLPHFTRNSKRGTGCRGSRRRSCNTGGRRSSSEKLLPMQSPKKFQRRAIDGTLRRSHDRNRNGQLWQEAWLSATTCLSFTRSTDTSLSGWLSHQIGLGFSSSWMTLADHPDNPFAFGKGLLKDLPSVSTPSNAESTSLFQTKNGHFVHRASAPDRLHEECLDSWSAPQEEIKKSIGTFSFNGESDLFRNLKKQRCQSIDCDRPSHWIPGSLLCL